MSRKTKILVLCSAAIALGCYYFLVSLHLVDRQETLVLASGQFNDKTRIDIVSAELAETVAMEKPKADFLTRRSGSSSFGRADLRFSINKQNGKFRRGELSLPYPGLVLKMRLAAPSGKFNLDQAYFYTVDEVVDLERDANGCLSGFSRKAESLGAMANFRLEIEDGGGGWIPASGPFFPCDDAIALACSSFYPRNSPELKVKLIHPDKQISPITVSIPTPGYRKQLQNWKIEPKPWRRDLKEVSLEVTEIKSIRISQRNLSLPYPAVTITEVPEGQTEKAFRTYFESVEDPHGNRSSLDRLVILPGVDRLKYIGSSKRSLRFYRWDEFHVAMIAEGKWQPDGNAVQPLSLLASAQPLGISKLSLEEYSENNWLFELEGKGRRKDLPGKWRFVLFFDDEEHSSKAIYMETGTARPVGEFDQYKVKFRWKEALPAESRLRIGILPAIDEETFEMVLPVQR